MKNIVIIEDNFDHFQIIGKLIADSDIDVFPKNINSGQELCDFLTPVKAFIDTADATTRENRKNEFSNSEKMKQNNCKISDSIYIVDYQLLADNNNINGLKFCEYIDDIREGKIPAILFTVLDLDDVNVIQQKNDFTNKFPNSKVEFERKVLNQANRRVKTWDEYKKNEDGTTKIDDIVTYSSELGTRLKNTINRLCPEKITPKKNMEDEYEH
ncbi:hypothetical protein [Dysgonomonas reticulitermitis]